jgi:predicted transcriptional regulator
MFDNFFEARDELDRAVSAGHFDKLPGISLAIFRYLLEHAFYSGRSYGFVNHKRCGVQTLMAYTNFSKNAVTNALTNLEQAHLIHRRPRPIGTGGSNPDEITITWPVFHAEDDSDRTSEGLSEGPEGPSQDSDRPSEGLSFLDKNVKNSATSTSDDDVVASTPSRENQGKGSTRSKGSARSSSTARATTRAKDESPVDGVASVEEYVLDLEGCAGDLEVRLFSEDDGQIDVPVLARKLRNLCIRYEFHCLWSDILRLVPVDDKWWWQASNKEVPAGYLLRLIELDMIRMNKEKKADELEDRLLELFNGREYLPGHRISELMPDVDPELTMMLSNRLLEEGVIKKHPTKINCFVLGTPRPVQDDAPVAVATPVKFTARDLADKIVTALARGQVREDYIAQRVNSDYGSIQPALELLVADGTITRSIKPEDSYYLYVLTELSVIT